MATAHEKLASSLEVLRSVRASGVKVVHAKVHAELTRTHLERLVKEGFLKPIIAGWYRFSDPSERDGDTTSWYAAADAFMATYAAERFGNRWQLGPEHSLTAQTGGTLVQRQLIIQAPDANNQVVTLPHGSSLFLYRLAEDQLDPRAAANQSGLRLQALELSLFKASPAYFNSHADAAQIAFRRADEMELTRLVLEGGSTTIAGRFAGGLRAVGRSDEADQLLRTMRAAGHDVRVSDPFEAPLPQLGGARTESPYAQRVRAMWARMRPAVVAAFEAVPAGASHDADQLQRDVEERYVADAYNSLSIEGYTVNDALIEQVRSGAWSPDFSEQDKRSRDALAAKGYAEAFKQVLQAVGQTVRDGSNSGQFLKRHLSDWHLALFSSSVRAGIVKAADLAGYRNRPVFIINALHVPPPHEAVRDCMPVFMELLEAEAHGGVRAVLGHFAFVFIHPYIDGNGRLGRFIMNFMLTTAGYVWTIVPVKRRKQYMEALEQASTHQNVTPFAEFIAELVTQQTAEPLGRE